MKIPDCDPEQVRIFTGDCRAVLATLPERSVQCCVTSPPYYGLRNYETATWEGGDPACDHGAAYRERRNSARQAGVGGCVPGSERDPPKSWCKCGAIRVDQQIGIEQTPDAYVAQMVEVFRGVKRVLKDDGTVWLNLGDLYINKQLQMMPARVALALQADGWVLRSSIVWHKPNPMPESVKNRPTSAHEMVFMLAKQERYFYDADAVREENSPRVQAAAERYEGDPRIAEARKKGNLGAAPDRTDSAKGLRVDNNAFANPNGRNARNVWTIAEPKARLRADIPPEKRAYVLAELAHRGLV